MFILRGKSQAHYLIGVPEVIGFSVLLRFLLSYYCD